MTTLNGLHKLEKKIFLNNSETTSSEKIKIGQMIDLCMMNNFKYVLKPKMGVGNSSRSLLFFLNSANKRGLGSS